MTGNMWREGQSWQQPRERRLPRLQTSMPGKPQIYVHFEFGVSFSLKQGPKPHSMTYMSKALKERDQRTRPAPHPHAPHNHHHYQHNNRLAQPTPHHPRPRALTNDESLRRNPPSYNFDLAGYSLPQSDPFAPGIEIPPTYERGGSAPPPMSDSPWDAEPEPVGFSALPRQRAALPRPGQAPRFGPDGMPLSANSWPRTGLNDEDDAGESSRRWLNVPDSGQARDLATLSSAMMTVDNGFEDQWWYQGAREAMAEESSNVNKSKSLPTSPYDYEDTYMPGSTLGWAIASEDLRPVRTSSLRNHETSTMTEEWVQATRQFSMGVGAPHSAAATQASSRREVVSPLTEYYQPTPQQHQRQVSELWMYK